MEAKKRLKGRPCKAESLANNDLKVQQKENELCISNKDDIKVIKSNSKILGKRDKKCLFES